MGVSYFTQSGTEYSVDSNGMMIREGMLYKADGETFKYLGIVDRQHAEAVLVNDGRRLPKQILLFLLRDKLGITLVEFEKINSHLDDRVQFVLVYCSEALEQIILTSPIKPSAN